jgi:hypothetical protein
MQGQFNLEEITERYKSFERISNFHNFWREEFHNEKQSKKKKLLL